MTDREKLVELMTNAIFKSLGSRVTKVAAKQAAEELLKLCKGNGYEFELRVPQAHT